ncbi:MAG: hypothetical protein DLM61_07275 [Pseudonocardiales bacterium]|nr:MAG: hypothetical protein DLM61_07275 [Pseudonocardiales bacterium]
MRTFVMTVVAAVSVLAIQTQAGGAPSPGDGGGPVVCTPTECHAVVIDPGHNGSPGGGNQGGGPAGCSWKGRTVPCSIPAAGFFNASDGCYYKVADPLPTSGPVLVEYQQYGGGIYWATCPFGGSGGYVWLAQPPAGLPPSPAQLAQRAAASFRFPKPSGHRSPSETLRYQGYPFSYVQLWLFYWTDPGTWRTLTATARAGGVFATVTAKPVSLTYDPGDGSSAVSCGGPGRPWTDADGNRAPSGGACGYQYKAVTSSPITSTQTITWKITWVGSGGTSGALPDQSTSKSGQLNVMQIQTVVTR